MKMIVGLGNPGQKYLLTRHNIGFLVVDALAEVLNETQNWKKKAEAFYIKTQFQNQDCLLVKPQTYMNLSGQSVLGLMTFFKIQKEDLLVIQDDLSLAFGAIRYQHERSPGGHNGVKDIHARIGPVYSRLKVGILNPHPGDVTSFVLQNFSIDEQKDLPEVIHRLIQSLEQWVNSNTKLTANLFNTKKGYPWDSKSES